jgi:hypothetical protein
MKRSMNTRQRTIRGLAARLARVPRFNTADVGLFGLMAGALHSLEKAEQLGYQDQRGQSRDASFFASEFRTTLKRISKGDTLRQPWLGGFYFINALLRLAALLDRLKVPLTVRSRSRLIHDVDWFKHRAEAHPVSSITTSWDDALKVATATCGALEGRPAGDPLDAR